MKDSTPALTYGARFFDELQRLTRSTAGVNYANDSDWILRLDSTSPEEFARAAFVRASRALLIPQPAPCCCPCYWTSCRESETGPRAGV
jgi:hypothetical protein